MCYGTERLFGIIFAHCAYLHDVHLFSKILDQLQDYIKVGDGCGVIGNKTIATNFIPRKKLLLTVILRGG